MKRLSPTGRAKELIRGWLRASRESARAETAQLVRGRENHRTQEHESHQVTMMKTRYCGDCGASTKEEDQKYCTQCGAELPAQSWGQRVQALSAALLKRAAIAALVPLFGMGIALSAGPSDGPTLAQYVGSVYAVGVLIAVWEFMLWTLRTCRRAEGIRIPLVLAILTGWWVYGIATATVGDSPDGDLDLVSPMLSDLPFVPLEAMAREMEADWEKNGEITTGMIITTVAISLPTMFSGLILLFTVPTGWIILGVAEPSEPTGTTSYGKPGGGFGEAGFYPSRSLTQEAAKPQSPENKAQPSLRPLWC